jgi:serine/threonine protein kinase
MSDEGDKGAPPTQETIQDQPVENPSPSNSPTQKLAPRKLTIDDFIVVKCLGKGHFGEVVLAKGKADKKKYAIKMLSKEFMEKVDDY